MAISTSNLNELPAPKALENLTISLAILEAVMSGAYPYFGYDAQWDVAKGERLATMNDGSGDHYFLLFTPAGAFLKGFGHESIMTPWAHDPKKVWPGVLDQVPSAFTEALNEPAFDMGSTTFCIWRLSGDDAWRRGKIAFPEDNPDPDGSKDILWMLDGNPETYVRFSEDYYEREIPIDAVAALYAHKSLTPELASLLNPEAQWTEVQGKARSLGYPLS